MSACKDDEPKRSGISIAEKGIEAKEYNTFEHNIDRKFGILLR